MQYSIDRSVGECSDIGKARDEALVVGNDRDHLRLLQHDLRDPDAIRRAFLLPGQIVAPATCMPLDEGARHSRVRAIHHANCTNGRAPKTPAFNSRGIAAARGVMLENAWQKRRRRSVLERGSRASNRRRAWSTLVGGHVVDVEATSTSYTMQPVC